MFRSPGLTPAVAAAACLFLIGPWVDRDAIIYEIAAGMLAIGVVLWAITWLTNRGIRAKSTGFRDIEHLETSSVSLDGPDHRVAYACPVTQIPDLASLHALGPAQQPAYPDPAAVDAAVARLRTDAATGVRG